MCLLMHSQYDLASKQEARKEGRKEGRMSERKAHKKARLWTSEEDRVLKEYVEVNGKGKWNCIPQLTGLRRSGKSCRLRWTNHLNPSIKQGDFSQQEEDLIIRLHTLLGNRWSLIAGRVPGRTDNQVKNRWNSHLSKKLGIKDVKIGKPTKTSTSYTRSSINMGGVLDPISSNAQNGKIFIVKDLDVASSKGISKAVSFGISSGEKSSIFMEKHQTPSFFHGEDDDMIFNAHNFLEFLNEYSVDFSWTSG